VKGVIGPFFFDGNVNGSNYGGSVFHEIRLKWLNVLNDFRNAARFCPAPIAETLPR
jgi:hypothetical protein